MGQRLDMLKFQTNEIQTANVKVGEDEALSAERDRLENYQKINENLANSYQVLTGVEPNALDQLGQAMSAMQEIADLDEAFRGISESINNAFYELQDTASDISHQIDNLSWDEGRLDEIEKRLETLTELKRKYGQNLAAVLDYYQKIKAELDEMESSNADNDDLQQQVQAAQDKVKTLGQKLSKARHKAALQLKQAVQKELADLYMDKAEFSVIFHESDKIRYTETGADQVEFYIRTNLGEGSKPLAKIASGGELSRIMLAIKTIFSRNEGVTSIIFDEVDTGVSAEWPKQLPIKLLSLVKAHRFYVLRIYLKWRQWLITNFVFKKLLRLTGPLQQSRCYKVMPGLKNWRG